MPHWVTFYRAIGRRNLGRPVEEKTKNTTLSFILQGSWNKNSGKTCGWEDQEYLNNFNTTAWLEAQIWEDLFVRRSRIPHWVLFYGAVRRSLGRPVDENIKNTTSRFILQGSWKKTSAKTCGWEDEEYHIEFFITGQLEEEAWEYLWTTRWRIAHLVLFYRAFGRITLGRPVNEKMKNTKSCFISQGCCKKKSVNTCGWEDQEYHIEFYFTWQLEEELWENLWMRRSRIPHRVLFYRAVGRRTLGKPMNEKVKNTTSSFILQGSWKKNSGKTCGWENQEYKSSSILQGSWKENSGKTCGWEIRNISPRLILQPGWKKKSRKTCGWEDQVYHIEFYFTW